LFPLHRAGGLARERLRKPERLMPAATTRAVERHELDVVDTANFGGGKRTQVVGLAIALQPDLRAPIDPSIREAADNPDGGLHHSGGEVLVLMASIIVVGSSQARISERGDGRRFLNRIGFEPPAARRSK